MSVKIQPWMMTKKAHQNLGSMSESKHTQTQLDRFFDLKPLEALYFWLILALCGIAVTKGIRTEDPILLIVGAALFAGVFVWRFSAGGSPVAVLGGGKRSVAVDLSAFAPRQVEVNGTFILSIWAYRPEDHAEARKRAMSSGGGIKVGETAGVEFPQRGHITVRLDMPTLDLSTKEMSFYWTGTPASVSFLVKVPRNAILGKHYGNAQMLANGIPFSTLHLAVNVGKSNDQRTCQAAIKLEAVKRVFASYSVKDMYEVMGRLQGLRILSPDVDIFLDVYSLRQGELFKDRILSEVKSREIFLLFWSRNAAASAWVELEWRTAAEKTSGSIVPVPLEPASKAPPPIELSNLNFNDYFSYQAHLLKELEELQTRLTEMTLESR